MPISNQDLEIHISIYQTLPKDFPKDQIKQAYNYLLMIGHSDNFLRRLFERSFLQIPDLNPPHLPVENGQPTQPSLTPNQVAVIRCLLDVASPRPLALILQSLEIPTQVFNVWMEDYYFRDIYTQVLYNSFDKVRLLAITNLLARAASGDLNAINTLSGQFNNGSSIGTTTAIQANNVEHSSPGEIGTNTTAAAATTNAATTKPTD